VSVHLQPFPTALDRLGADAAATREVLQDMQRSTSAALEALREITAGILPPLLARRGLATALREQAARSAARTRVTTTPAVEERRFDPSVEAAAYLAAVTVLQGTAADGPDAELFLDLTDDRLTVRVRGGCAVAPAEHQQVLDRVQAVGGGMTERTGVDGTDEVFLTIPVAAGRIAGELGRPTAPQPTDVESGLVASGHVEGRRPTDHDRLNGRRANPPHPAVPVSASGVTTRAGRTE
jgi:hypothetical protein